MKKLLLLLAVATATLTAKAQQLPQDPTIRKGKLAD